MHEKIVCAASAFLLVGSAAQAQNAPDTALMTRASDPALQWGPCPPVFPGDCKIAVLHGDPAKPNADVVLRVGGGYTIPPHRHTSVERMILVGGRLRVRYEGSAPTVMNAGNYAFGPAGRPHEAKCLSRTPCTLFIAFEGPVDAEAVGGPIR